MKVIIPVLFCITVTAWAQNRAPELPLRVPASDQAIVAEPHGMPKPLPPNNGRRPGIAAPTKADDGVSMLSIDPTMVRQFLTKIDVIKSVHSSSSDLEGFNAAVRGGDPAKMVPVVVKDLGALKLTFNPATVSSGKLIGASPQGAIVDGAWTGVERMFEVQGGVVSISESDLKATGGAFYMLKSAVNTSIGGKPANSSIYKDDAARQIEQVIWVNNGKEVVVTYAPDMASGRYGLAKANAAISGLSIASSLR